MQYSRSNAALTAFELGVLAVLVLVAFNYQFLLDQYALASFQPGSQMSGIINRLDLTKQAKGVLYRSRPRVDDKVEFNSDCQTKPHELELGCYFRGGIYVFKISNPSLESEMDVVTAHELLHAEWDRMTPGQQQVLGSELEHEYSSINDPALNQRMASYAQTEPGQQDNELHSILGTEYGHLSPALEQHYAQYFTDRTAIVSAHSAYERVFTAQGSQLQAQLAQIRSEKAELASLNAQMADLRAAGDVQSYNALVPRQNSLVDKINSQIVSYQQAVETYNALSKSLDSQAITDIETSAQ
jgi:hypothetical protein